VRAEVDADEELHDQIRHGLEDADVERLDDVRVAQARDELALAEEPAADAGVLGEVLVEDLDRYRAPECDVQPLEDARRSAMADEANDLVCAEACALQLLAA
jgi:hypothetical protein